MARRPEPPDRFLTRAEVEARTGLSRSAIYRAMRAGRMPLPYRVGLSAVRWSSHEIEEWATSRPRSHGVVATGGLARHARPTGRREHE